MADNQLGGFDIPGYDAQQRAVGRKNFLQIDGAHRQVTVGSVVIADNVIDPNIPFIVAGSQNSYFGINVDNLGTGGTVSADFVAIASPLQGQGASGTFADFGINAHSWNDSTYAVMDADGAYCYNSAGNMTIGAAGTGSINLFTGSVSTKASIRMVIDNSGNIAAGTGAVGSAATDGFFYIRGGTGVPTGTPTAKTGMIPMYYNITTNVLYLYNGAWKAGTFA